MSKLDEAALIAMRDCVALREGEEVLIMSNFEGDALTISRALFEQTKALGGKPVIVIQKQKNVYDIAENSAIAAIRSEQDVMIYMTADKLGKDPYGMNVGYVGRDGQKYDNPYFLAVWGNRRSRGFFSPGATVDMFQRCVPIDYAELKRRSANLKAVFDAGKEVHVTSPAGTDVRLSIEGRQGKTDNGDYSVPGQAGNLPAGETYVSPVVGSTRGTIVFDGTIILIGNGVIPKTPVRVDFTDGYVSKVSGGDEAKELLKVIERGERLAKENGLKEEERNARHLGELGIGLNYAARMTGNILEDEKLGKTVHFAIGANYDNDAKALIHQDCLVMNPSMWVDEKQIMKNGNVSV
jgi:aminopeptidase